MVYLNLLVSGVLCISIWCVLGESSQGDFEGIELEANHTVPLGHNATFSCKLLPEGQLPEGFTDFFMMVDEYNSSILKDEKRLQMRMAFIEKEFLKTITLTILANEVNNNTLVFCRVSGSKRTYTTETIILIVQGPPEPPEPKVMIMNSTHLNITWAAPFTWSNHPLTEYRLVVMEQQSFNLLINRTLSPNVTEVVFSHGELYPGQGENSSSNTCTVLEFRMTAKSAIGESAKGVATGGFPVEPGEFDDSSLTDKVTFTKDHSPIVTLQFKLPAGCEFEVVDIYLTFTHQPSNTTEIFGPFSRSYTSDVITLTVQSPNLKQNRIYKVLVIMETKSGTVTSDPYDLSTNFNAKPDAITKETHGAQRIIAAVCSSIIGVVLLVLAILAIVVCFCYYRKRRKSAHDMHGSHLPPALPTPSQGMVSNPIYEGEEDDYETIDGCQEDYRDAKLMQLSTVDGIKGTNLRDGGQHPPFPITLPPAGIPKVDYGNGTGLKTQHSVDPGYCNASIPAGSKSTAATADNLCDSDSVSDADSSDS